MPAANAYRRAPLVDPAYVPVADASVHADGLQKKLTEKGVLLDKTLFDRTM